MRTLKLLAPLVLLIGGTASAQTIYMDVHDGAANNLLAQPTYGAVPGTPGTWDLVDLINMFNTMMPANLFGVNPGPNPVAIVTLQPSFNVLWSPTTAASCSSWGMDEVRLYDGIRSSLSYRLVFQGLDPGSYTMYTYGHLEDAQPTFTRVQPLGGTAQVITNTCPAGVHSSPESFVIHQVTVPVSGTLTVEYSMAFGNPKGFGFPLNGIQLVYNGDGSVGTLFCPGDGSIGVCGCGNINDGSNTPAAGCANSASPGGALLAGFGSDSVSADDLTLVVSGAVPPAGPVGVVSNAFLFESMTQTPTPFSFQEGTLCLVTPRRLQFPSADLGGMMTQMQAASLLGAVPGTTSFLQVYYPDPPAGSPCGNGWNLTNGLEILWQP